MEAAEEVYFRDRMQKTGKQPILKYLRRGQSMTAKRALTSVLCHIIGLTI